MAKQNLTGYEKASLNQYNKVELMEIAKTYMVGGSSTGFSKYRREELVRLIREDRDYMNADPKKKTTSTRNKKSGSFLGRQKTKLQASIFDNRINPIVRDLIGTEPPDELMTLITSALDNTKSTSPTPGKYYTFKYYAKTPNILYDVHPLIKFEKPTEYGFIGFNYHWGEYRQYTWPELGSQLYEISSGEWTLLQQIPYQKIVLNS